MIKFLLFFSLLLSVSAKAQQPFWQQTNGPSGGGSRLILFNSHGDIFDIGRHLLRSTDNGISWKDLTPDFLTGGLDAMISSGDFIYILLNDSLHRSTDNGVTWTVVLKNISDGSVFASKTGPIYVESPFGTGLMWRSLDDGDTWTDLSSAMPPRVDANFFVMPTGELIFVDFEKTHFYYSLDNGNSWQEQSTPLLRLTDIEGTTNGDLFCGFALPDYATDIYHAITIRSTDNGKTWDSLRSSFNVFITSNDLLCGILDSLIYSSDYGKTWNAQYLPDITTLGSYTVFPDLKGNIYWSIPERVSRYLPMTKTVEEISIPIAPVDNLLIDTDGTMIARGSTYFSLSKDKGQTWSTVTGYDSFAYPGKFANIAKDSNGGIIGLSYSGLYRSTDVGLSWIRTDTLIWSYTQSNPQLLVAPNGSIFASTPDNIFFRSTDLGKTWNQVSKGLTNLLLPEIICDKKGMLYVYSGQNIYRSSDNGDSWQFMINIIDPYLYKHIVTTSNVSCMAALTTGEIFAGTTHDGVIVSTDQGVTWNVLNENIDSAQISGLFAAPNGDIFGISIGGSLNAGIIYRPFQGSRWYNVNSGLGITNDLTTIAFAPDGTAYLGTSGRGVWRSQGAVNSVSQNTNNSENVSLHISPNPASSQITMTYSLPEHSFTSIELCDALGRTIQRIENGFQDSGVHNQVIHFNGLADGVYLLRLATPARSIMEKVVINK